MAEDWYRSWAPPGTDGTWGWAGDVDEAQLRPEAATPCAARPEFSATWESGNV